MNAHANSGMQLAAAWDGFAVGENLYNGSNLPVTIFSAYLGTDDYGGYDIDGGTASASMRTHWVFTPTQDTNYELKMLGETGGWIVYSLRNITSNSLVSQGSDQNKNPATLEANGTLKANNSYALTMSLIRSGAVGDGLSFLSFSVDDNFQMPKLTVQKATLEPPTSILLSEDLPDFEFSDSSTLPEK